MHFDVPTLYEMHYNSITLGKVRLRGCGMTSVTCAVWFICLGLACCGCGFTAGEAPSPTMHLRLGALPLY